MARLKLARAGIGDYSSRARAASVGPRLARRAAAARPGPRRRLARDRTVVIGDTPRDIACARADDVRVVAVATGPFAVEALADADAVVEDAHASCRCSRTTSPAAPLTGGAAAAAARRLGGASGGRRGGTRSRSPRRSPLRGAEGVAVAGQRGASARRRIRDRGVPLRCEARGAAIASGSDCPSSSRSTRTCSTVVMIVEPPGEPTASSGRRRADDRRRHRAARPLAASAVRVGVPGREVEVGELVVEQEAAARHDDAGAAGLLDRERVGDDVPSRSATVRCVVERALGGRRCRTRRSRRVRRRRAAVGDQRAPLGGEPV